MTYDWSLQIGMSYASVDERPVFTVAEDLGPTTNARSLYETQTAKRTARQSGT